MSARLERLINLVIALRETRVGMTAEDVRERVAGYGQPDHEAFRRMFERDKADLRALGVPVTVERPDDRDAYRIPPRDYDLPPIALQPDELAALGLALQATGLGPSNALRKLEVDADEVPAPQPGQGPSTALAVSLEAPRHRDALLTAQFGGRRVRFSYRALGREPEVRTMDPAGLVHRAGRWYVVGHDTDRGARRAFRLDRITSEVEEIGPAAPVDATVDVTDVLPSDTEEVHARIAADSSVSWIVARRARGDGAPTEDGRTLYTVPARDSDELLGWLLRLGPRVEVVGPPHLRQRVVAALDELVEQHP